MMRRLLIAAMVICGLMMSVHLAEAAGPCEIDISGDVRDVFDNVVWSGPDYINVGTKDDSSECLSDAYSFVEAYAYLACSFRGSGVYIDIIGDVYFDSGWVNGWYAPSSCRSNFGLNYYSTLEAPQTLYPTDPLFSPNEDFVMYYQEDGNLVVYALPSGTPIWAINCWTHACDDIGEAQAAIMQYDGNFVVYNLAQEPVFATNTSDNPGSFLAMDNSGHLTIYSPDGDVLWDNY